MMIIMKIIEMVMNDPEVYLLVTMSTDERSRSGLQTDTDLKMESVVFNSGAFSACLS